MLVLTRKLGQTIRIGNDIQIEILNVNGENVKIGISAPSDVLILRDEVYRNICTQNRSSVVAGSLNLSGFNLEITNEVEIDSNKEIMNDKQVQSENSSKNGNREKRLIRR